MSSIPGCSRYGCLEDLVSLSYYREIITFSIAGCSRYGCLVDKIHALQPDFSLLFFIKPSGILFFILYYYYFFQITSYIKQFS